MRQASFASARLVGRDRTPPTPSTTGELEAALVLQYRWSVVRATRRITSANRSVEIGHRDTDSNPNGWTFGDRFKELATRVFDNTDRFVNIQRRNRTRSYRFDDQIGWTLDGRFERIGNSCVRQHQSLRQTSSVGIARSIVARTSCVCYDPLKDAAELRWWPLPHKPDRTKPCTGAREFG